MAQIQTAHTADLDPATLDAVRALMEDVFAGELTEHDVEHALGGVHALVWEGDALVAHGAAVQRRLLHRGRALRAGYVEAVAVAREHRGHGHGAAAMAELERVIRGAYDLGALGSSDEALGFYAHRGWRCWRGPTSALTPDGIVRTPDEDGGIHVLELEVALDLDGELTCDWRDGDVW